MRGEGATAEEIITYNTKETKRRNLDTKALSFKSNDKLGSKSSVPNCGRPISSVASNFLGS